MDDETSWHPIFEIAFLTASLDIHHACLLSIRIEHENVAETDEDFHRKYLGEDVGQIVC